MSKRFLQTVWIVIALGVGSCKAASNGVVGMAVADGSFEVDHSRVWNNATLFEGSLIHTGTGSSELLLASGGRLFLRADSRAAVHQKKLVLEHGFGELRHVTDYRIEARSLEIVPAGPETVAWVKVDDRAPLQVAAAAGMVRVLNSSGVLVANIEAGNSLDFELQEAGAVAPTRATGCLLEKSGKLILAAQTANVVLELQGAGLEKELGNRIEITGLAADTPADVGGASQMIRVAGWKRVSTGGCKAVAKKLEAATTLAGGAAGATAAGAAAGASIGAGTIAVIGGVAAAATVGGLAAAGSLPGQGQSQSSASR